MQEREARDRAGQLSILTATGAGSWEKSRTWVRGQSSSCSLLFFSTARSSAEIKEKQEGVLDVEGKRQSHLRDQKREFACTVSGLPGNTECQFEVFVCELKVGPIIPRTCVFALATWSRWRVRFNHAQGLSLFLLKKRQRWQRK